MPSISPHRMKSCERSEAATPGPRPPTHRCRDGGATPHPEERRGGGGGGSSRAPKRGEDPSPLPPLNLPPPPRLRPRPLPSCKKVANRD
jgi:hypothetical protein